MSRAKPNSARDWPKNSCAEFAEVVEGSWSFRRADAGAPAAKMTDQSPAQVRTRAMVRASAGQRQQAEPEKQQGGQRGGSRFGCHVGCRTARAAHQRAGPIHQ